MLKVAVPIRLGELKDDRGAAGEPAMAHQPQPASAP
jgi:hypothetical protein